MATTAAPQDLKSWLLDTVHPAEFGEKDLKEGIRFEALVPAERIREVAAVYKSRGYFLESLTAVDFTEGYELVYHFNKWGKVDRSCIRVLAPKKQDESAEAPSVSGVYPSADWFEREIHEMFGVVFEGHPGLKRLLLPESSEIYPLRKSFKGEPKGADVEQSLKLIQEDATGFELRTPRSVSREGKDYYLNLGPQHPSTHGVLRVLLHLDGERLIGAEPIIGYSHRHQEKMMEIQNYLACWPNFGRLDYVGAMSYNFGYALLAEKAMGVVPPPRAEYIRVMTTELNRISSHLLWMGTFLLDLGGFTPFFYCFDDREKILDILEMTTGERLTYDYFRFGGVDHDVPEDFVPAIKKFMPAFKKRLKDYKGLVTNNVIFQHRVRGLGYLSRETALDYGVTGPSLRASGVAFDLRRDEPYSLYPHLDFEVVTATEGDAWSRYLVRVREMEESLKIVAQLMDKLPAGEFKTGKLPKNLPKGEYYSAVESARGSFGIYLVADGGMNPYRIKLRTPSFSNLNAFPAMVKGVLISDIVAILGSIDIVLPEIDR